MFWILQGLITALERLDMEELGNRFQKRFSAWLKTLSVEPLEGLAGACATYLRHWGSGGGSYRIERAAKAVCITDRPARLALLLYAAIRAEGTDAIVTCQLIRRSTRMVRVLLPSPYRISKL